MRMDGTISNELNDEREQMKWLNNAGEWEKLMQSIIQSVCHSDAVDNFYFSYGHGTE